MASTSLRRRRRAGPDRIVEPPTSLWRRWTNTALALILALAATVAGLATAPASAATPEYEITGRWVDQPDTISRGDPVVAEWRVNVNDADNPPSNEPVDNVTATFIVDKAFFDEIPDMCLVDGVDPVSSISEDGKTLTCNFGTVRMGTALVVQTPVVANGVTGEEVVLDGTSPSGETKELPPIPIRNPFAMDVRWVSTSAYENWNSLAPGERAYVDVDLQWSLRLGKGSDPGPNSVTYRLRTTTQDGSPVTVGIHPTGLGHPDWQGVRGCTAYDGFGVADGHPFSSVPGADRHTNFVGSCTLTPVAGQPGVFDLTLSDINYDLTNVPTHDSAGNPLPINWHTVASGSVWLRVHTSEAGSVSLVSNAPTYTAPTGQTYPDLPSNNSSNKPYTLPGGFSAGWYRPYTGSGGQIHDDTYRVAAGTTIQGYVALGRGDDAPANDQRGICSVLDPAYVDFDDTVPIEYWASLEGGGAQQLPGPFGVLEYYTGGVGNPNTFNCGTGSWTTTQPAPGAITAVRLRYPFSAYAANNAATLQFRVPVKIQTNAPVGQDIWTFGSLMFDGTWNTPADPGTVVTPTPDARYPHTNGRRDIVRVVTAVPYIEKSSDRSTVTPGVPADFTLTYSANGEGLIPDSVDDYQIRDVLPLGMTYEPGSADPEPVVSTDAQGRQVLTWTLDGVTTNEEHELTYQAVADSSVEPGTPLTNTAVSSLDGQSSPQVSETVTTTVNGYTTILKTADVEFIPNEEGDGVGSGSWTVTIESFDPLPQAFTDTIDILPYNGDQRGTSFSGTYTLDEMVVPAGATVYYTDADPSTLSDDPADESNGAAGDPTGNDVGWTTERPEQVTAIRVIGPELEPGGTFSFQVPITTDGAHPQDVYVNRAQARAEHTELVMRTSASLTVTDYLVEKTSDPESGSTVRPGDTVTYTVTVTQQGDVPAGAVWKDNLANVFDDATYNEDVAADIGEATLEDDVLSWRGTIPVGGTATITYSVTVNQTDNPDKLHLENVVTSPGCVSPIKCTTIHEGPGRFVYSKTSKPKSGTTVKVGDTVRYKVRIAHKGRSPVEDAKIIDDLSDVLDDATFNDDIEASAGEAELDGRKLRWIGDLNVGDVVTLTYSVTVRDAGDDQLLNVVTHRGPGTCVPAPDGNPDCTTRHDKGGFTVSKTSNPKSGSTVDVGDSVTYKVRIEHQGKGPIEDAKIVDDLSEVLDDATFNHDIEASAGKAKLDGTRLRWTGDLAAGDVVRLTYSVTVTDTGNDELLNVVTPKGPGVCVPAPDQNPDCTTRHDKEQPDGGLPDTGSGVSAIVIGAGVLLVLLGTGAALIARRRSNAT